MERTLEITNLGVRCFAITRNLLEMRYPDYCSLSGQKITAQEICNITKLLRKTIHIPEYGQSNAPLIGR